MKQYKATVLADGKPWSTTEYSDFFENGAAARRGYVSIMADQGYAVFSVVIGEKTEVHVDPRIVLKRNEEDEAVWEWSVKVGALGGMSDSPEHATNDARAVLGETIHCWEQQTDDMQCTLFDASRLLPAIIGNQPQLCLARGLAAMVRACLFFFAGVNHLDSDTINNSTQKDQNACTTGDRG